MQDPELPSVAVLDLSEHAGPHNTADRSCTCSCTAVDAELFAARPGLQVLQVTWHPGMSLPQRLFNAEGLKLEATLFDPQKSLR